MTTDLITRKITELRHSVGYTQSFIADYLGISRQTYSHYETGRIHPNLDTLCRLAKLYDFPIETLLSLVIPESYAKSVSQTSPVNEMDEYLAFANALKNKIRYKGCTVMEKKLLYTFQKLGSKEQKQLIQIAKVLAGKESI